MIDEPLDTGPREFATIARMADPAEGKCALTIVVWLATMPVGILLATSALGIETLVSVGDQAARSIPAF